MEVVFYVNLNLTIIKGAEGNTLLETYVCCLGKFRFPLENGMIWRGAEINLQWIQNVTTNFWAPFGQPVDVPLCGFTGANCSYTDDILIAAAVFTLLIMCIASIYGRYKW